MVVQIPILDCSEIAGKLEEIQFGDKFKNFAEKLGGAFRDFGFVYLVHHDLRPETVDLPSSYISIYFSLN